MDRIKLDLSKHCIETEVKTLYNQVLNKLVQVTEPEPEIEKEFGNLVSALKTLDFQKLRGLYPELAGGSQNINAELIFSGKEVITLFLNGKKIDL